MHARRALSESRGRCVSRIARKTNQRVAKGRVVLDLSRVGAKLEEKPRVRRAEKPRAGATKE
eukprot:5323750-Pleurochrysis_carterae.AAC.1